jgi:hypothetical protein
MAVERPVSMAAERWPTKEVEDFLDDGISNEE